MNPKLTTDERLIKPLLAALDDAMAEPPSPHPEHEILAMFAAGQLDTNLRVDVLEHLDQCRDCRQHVSLLVSIPADVAEDDSREANVVRPAASFWQQRSALAWFAVAASLLLAVALWGFSGRNPGLAERRAYEQSKVLLARADFAQARHVIQQAEREGIVSDRLRSLESEALREIPGPIALAQAGRLTDFGYEPGGVVARDPVHQAFRTGLQPAEAVLDQAGSQDLEVLLNRGHLLLSLNRPQEALRDLAIAAKLAPADPLVSLGQGLARFMLEDYTAAEADFRRVLAQEPGNIPARIDLALTLEEEGKDTESLEIWRALSQEELSDSDRQTVERAIRQLEAPTK